MLCSSNHHNAIMWRITRRSISTCVTLRQLVPASAVPLVANAALAGAKARKQAKVVVSAQDAQLDSSLAADVETLVNQPVKPKRGRPKTKSAASLDGSSEVSASDAGSSDLSSASSGSDSDQAAPGAVTTRKRSKTPRGGKMAIADASAAAQASAVEVTAAWSKRANLAVVPPTTAAPVGDAAALSSSAVGAAAAGVAAVASHVAGAASAFEASLLSAGTAAAAAPGSAATAAPQLSPAVAPATGSADAAATDAATSSASDTGSVDTGSEYAEQLRLYARQYDSEMRALDNHVASYKAIVSDLVTMGRGSTLPVAQRMAVSWFVPLAEGIDKEQAAAMEGRFSSPEAQQVAHLLMLLPPDKLAVMTIHEVLSGTLANAGAVAYGYLARRVGEAVQTEVNLTKLRYKNRRAWSTLAKEHKTEGGGNLHALRRKARTALEEEEDWEPRTTLKLGAYLVSLMIDTCRVEVGENGRLTAPRAGGGAAGGSGASGDNGVDQAAAAEAFAAALASTAGGSAGVASSARSAAGGSGGVGATAVSQAALGAAAAKQAALASTGASSPSTTAGAPTPGTGKELKPGVVFRGSSVGIASLYHSTLKVMRVPIAAAGGGGGGSAGGAAATSSAAAGTATAAAARAGAGASASPTSDSASALDDHEDMSLAATEDLAAAAAVEEDAAITAAAAAGGATGQPATGTAGDAAGVADAASSTAAKPTGTGLPAFKHVYAYANQLTLATGPHASTTDRTGPVRFSHAKAVGVIAMHPDLLKMMMDAVASFQHAALYPMVVKPRDWTGPTSGGFLKHQAPVLRLQGGVKQQADMLRSANCPKVYEALSIMGRTPWRMNQPVLDVVNAVWKSGGGKAEIPLTSDIELPTPPTDAEIEAAAAASGQSVEETRKVLDKRFKFANKRAIRENSDRHSLRCDMTLKLSVAEKYRDDIIYFPHNMDFRGRVYPLPPHLNHMGNDMCRGLLTFAHAKPLGERGLRWLKIHVSNLMGKDKISLDDRAAYTDDNLAQVFDSADKPLNGNGWWLKADSPWQALAACKELANAMRSSNPHEYACRLPVHQDGSCNGLQHYAALGRDAAGGSAVNLVPTPEDKPQDVYSQVLRLVLQKLDADARGDFVVAAKAAAASGATASAPLQGATHQAIADAAAAGVPGVSAGTIPPAAAAAVPLSPGDLYPSLFAADQAMAKAPASDAVARATVSAAIRQLAARFLIGKVDRKVVKQTVMTSVYGVTYIGARDQILARLEEKYEHHPMPVDEKDRVLVLCANYLAKTTLESLGDLFSSADAIKKWLGDVARLVALAEQPMAWITPLGLPVVQPYRRERSMIVSTVLQDVLLIDNSEQLPVSAQRQRSAFPPNYVHSLDSTHMMMTALDCHNNLGLTFTAVHDSYWTHACDIDVMNKSLRRQFIDLYSMPLLERFHSDLITRFPFLSIPDLPPRGSLNLEDVASSRYFFN